MDESGCSYKDRLDIGIINEKMKKSEVDSITKSKFFTVIPSKIKKDLNIFEYLCNIKDFIFYSSRNQIIEIIQNTINIRIKNSERVQSNNRLGKVILGNRGIGKSYILQHIAIHTGLSRPDLFIVYLNSEFINMKLLDILIEVAIKRELIDSSFKVEDLPSLLLMLNEKGITLILFIDELQNMYPEVGLRMYEKQFNIKLSIIHDICSIADRGDCLIIATGRHSLMDKAFQRISRDPRINYYPKLNDQNMVPITLLPITEREDFKNGLLKLHINIEDIHELFIKSGGIIRILISNVEMQLPSLKTHEKTMLIRVLLYLYRINKRQIEKDPLKRIFISQKDLTHFCLKYDENFKEETFKIWCDENYLLLYNESYSYLTADILLKIYERSLSESREIVE